MRRVYQGFGALLVLLYGWSAFSGWEPNVTVKHETLPSGARNAGGYRTWHFWSGGK